MTTLTQFYEFKTFKIPLNKNIIIKYNKNLLLIKNLTSIKKFKIPKTLIQFKIENNQLLAMLLINNNTSNFNLQKKTLIAIKNFIKSTLKIKKKKLTIVGIGYKAITRNETTLILKLGFSHLLFIKIPKDLIVNCTKSSNIQISGSSQKRVNEFAKLIKSYKKPEPYKGKGIFYKNETIKLKEGKKF